MHRPHNTRTAQRRSRLLRNTLTISEARLWNAIRRQQLGVKFRRQVPIGVWIADFACLNPRLVIEIDDGSHRFRDESARSDYINRRGFRIVRFTNEEVAKHLDDVVSTIRSLLP